VTFRPIIAKTDELAWQKAHKYVAKIADTFGKAAYGKQRLQQQGTPQNIGSQRALSFAEKSDLYDRALWTRTAAVTNAGRASTALVGSPETVAAAILDYVDRGADLVSIRGYDTLADAVDYGKHVLPLVRQELAPTARQPARAGHSRPTISATMPRTTGATRRRVRRDEHRARRGACAHRHGPVRRRSRRGHGRGGRDGGGVRPERRGAGSGTGGRAPCGAAHSDRRTAVRRSRSGSP
jgi:hypothetical protein